MRLPLQRKWFELSERPQEALGQTTTKIQDRRQDSRGRPLSTPRWISNGNQAQEYGAYYRESHSCCVGRSPLTERTIASRNYVEKKTSVDSHRPDVYHDGGSFSFTLCTLAIDFLFSIAGLISLIVDCVCINLL